MMRKDEFIWKGESSLTYGIYLISPFNVPSFVKRVEELVIQGKNGTQFIEEGSYASDICSANIVFKMESTTKEFHEIFEWLSGSGELVIPQRPDVVYKGNIYSLISPSQFIINEVYEFPISISVNPFAMIKEGLYFVPFPNSINAKGKLKAYPIIKITKSCNIIINGVRLSATLKEQGEGYINMETCEALDIVNNEYIALEGNFGHIPAQGKNIEVKCDDSEAKIMFRWCEL